MLEKYSRGGRGRVHNDNFHFRLSEIVRLADYIIGGINGKYLPTDPSFCRRKNRAGTTHKPCRHESRFGSQGSVDQTDRPLNKE